MTKAELVTEIAVKTGIEEAIILQTVESLMKVIRESLVNGENVYLRGFGSFIVKRRAQKIGRNITKNTFVVIPEHFIPAFKPVKTFVTKVKSNRRMVSNSTGTTSSFGGNTSNGKSVMASTSHHPGEGKIVRMTRTKLADKTWDDIRGMGGKIAQS